MSIMISIGDDKSYVNAASKTRIYYYTFWLDYCNIYNDNRVQSFDAVWNNETNWNFGCAMLECP